MINEIQQVQASAELLYGEREVEAALDHMATQINEKLAGANPVLLCVLNGGIVAAGRLLTRLTMPLTIDSISAGRYQNKIMGSTLEWTLKPATSLAGRTVLIVDDILDEGLTLKAIADYCREQGAAAVYAAVLVDKRLDRDKPVQADFVGVETENLYLFGYGMDYKGYLRNAAGIYACKARD